MKINLKFLRRQVGLTQREVARKLGVTKQAWSFWERRNRLPEARVESTSRILSAKVEELTRLTMPDSPGHIPLKARRRRPRPLCKGDCSVDKLLSTVPDCLKLLERVRAKLGEDYETFDLRWSRDTVWELLVAHKLIDHQCADLVEVSPRYLGAPMFIVADDLHTYAGDEPEFAVVLFDGDARMTFFSQIRIRCSDAGTLYRVDLLVCYSDGRGPREWVVVEVDGDAHDFTPEKDKQRGRDLRMPCIRVENAATRNENFATWLMWQVRERVKASRHWRRNHRRTLRTSA